MTFDNKAPTSHEGRDGSNGLGCGQLGAAWLLEMAS